MTDASGTATKRAVYKPFGEATDWTYGATATPETKGFIGERYDPDAGLQYLNARYYDPKLAIFIQPDWWEVTDPGVGTNRFTYSFNDPVNNLDKGGNACVPCAAAILGGVIGGFAQVGVDVYNGKVSGIRTYGAAIAGGAVAGATFGSGGLTISSLVARGALSGAAGTTTGSIVGSGKLPTINELAIGSGLGAATGPLGGRASGASGRFSGELDKLTPAELSFVRRELDAGRNIETIPTGGERTADFFIDGVRTELKTISGVEDISADGISAAIASRVMDGKGQSGHIVVDLTGQNGVTEEIANRGIRRAYGADRSAKIRSIRAVGEDFDVTVPRQD